MKKSARKKDVKKRLTEINSGRRKQNKVIPQIEKQELHCHACDRYVQFEIDVTLNGNHTIKCPKCGHKHYRVVKDGFITDARWQSSGSVYQTTNTSYTATSTYTSYGNSGTGDTISQFMYRSWMDTTAS